MMNLTFLNKEHHFEIFRTPWFCYMVLHYYFEGYGSC